MKKYIAFILCLSLVSVLCACAVTPLGSKSDDWWGKVSLNDYCFTFSTRSDEAVTRTTYCWASGTLTSLVQTLDGSEWKTTLYTVDDGSNVYALNTGKKIYAKAASSGVTNPLESFANYEYGTPKSSGKKTLDGIEYFTEVFGDDMTYTTNYFTEKDGVYTLYAVERTENGKLAQLMYDITLTKSGADGAPVTQIPTDYTESSLEIDTEITLPEGFFDD